MIIYSNKVLREPRKFLRFRLFGIKAETLYDEIIPRNNLGLFSKFNYLQNPPRNVKKIMVLGGEQTASSVCRVSWPDCLQEIFNQEGKTTDVINLAWPDAGPAHYYEYLEKEGLKFNPDLIVVNYVESDFYRNLKGASLSYLGQPVTNGQPCSYPLNQANGEATLYVSVVKGREKDFRLDSPFCVPSRPWGIFIQDDHIKGSQDILDLQEKVVTDFIQGAWSGLDAWLEHKKKLNPSFQPDFANLNAHDVRQFDTPEEQKIDEMQCVKYVADCFSKIKTLNIPVIFLHNFHFYEMEMEWKLSQALEKSLPSLTIVDMRAVLEEDEKDKEFLKTLYMIPDMGEKWNQKGHAFYAKMVRKMIKKHFTY